MWGAVSVCRYRTPAGIFFDDAGTTAPIPRFDADWLRLGHDLLQGERTGQRSVDGRHGEGRGTLPFSQ